MKDECCHQHPDNGDLAVQTESQRTETDLRDVNTALLEALENIIYGIDEDYSVLPRDIVAGRAAIKLVRGD